MPGLRIRSPLVLVAALAVPVAAAGQESPWDVEGELGASVFFGNTSQTTFTTRVATERADSAYDFSAQGSFTYSEATDAEGEDFVAKRSWSVETSADWRPYGDVSPFIFGGLESSLQRRIDLRYHAGGGGKVGLQRDERGRVDVSVALLGERTRFRPEADEPDETRARWSGRFRAEREFQDGRYALSTENFYRPGFSEFGDFVVESRSSASFRLNQIVTLQISLVDIYDSQAVERGARSNNDGQLLFSILSSF